MTQTLEVVKGLGLRGPSCEKGGIDDGKALVWPLQDSELMGRVCSALNVSQL